MKCKIYKEDGYDIHAIKLNKYKTTTFNIIFRKELKKEDISSFAILAKLLTESSKKYPKKRDISIELERLYSPLIYASTNIEGNSFCFDISYDFLNPKYCYDGYLEDVLRFPFELLNNPNINDGEFDSSSYNIALNNFKTTIEEEKEYADSYALRRTLECMDSNSPTSYSVFGYLEDLNTITPATLVETYNRLFKDFKIDIYIAGNLDMELAVKYIKKFFIVQNNDNKLCNLYIKNEVREKVKEITEYGNYEQASFVMLYNLVDFNKRERDIVLPIFNSIFGSNELTSKLYMNVREKNSLCYNIMSFFVKYSGIFMVKAGIDKNNKDKCIKLVNKCLEEMVNGNFSDEDITCAKKTRINQVRMREDSAWSIIVNQINKDLDNSLDSNELIEEFKTVTKEEIVSVAKRIKLNLIYMLCEGEDNGTI